MATDLFRTQPCHHADDQSAGNRRAEHQPPRMVLRTRGYQVDGPTLIEDKVGTSPISRSRHHAAPAASAPIGAASAATTSIRRSTTKSANRILMSQLPA